MTVLEAVKRSHTPAFMYKAAIAVAQAEITAPETVLWAHTGNVLLSTAPCSAETVLKPGVTVITTHRILFSCSSMGQRYARNIALLDIANIKPVTEGFLMSLHIYSLGDYLAIQGNSRTIKEFIAALKDAIAKVETIDPAELTVFQSPLAAKPGTPADKINLEPYFQTYYPDNARAAHAVHNHSDLDISLCQQLIDNYFNANLARAPKLRQESFPEIKHILSPEKAALEKRMKELDEQGVAYCPKCASTSISAKKRGFSVGRAVTASMFLSTEASLVAGAVGANKTECICMKCGHTWRP